MPAAVELHAGREPALHQGEIAGREMAVEVGHEGTHLDPGGTPSDGIERGPVTSTMRSSGTGAGAARPAGCAGSGACPRRSRRR